MTQDAREEVFSINLQKVIKCIHLAMIDQYKFNKALQDGEKEVWIDKDLNLVAPFEGWCVFNPTLFTFASYLDADIVNQYNIKAYLLDVVSKLEDIESSEVHYTISLEDYYEGGL
jgi:hypothetical protein